MTKSKAEINIYCKVSLFNITCGVVLGSSIGRASFASSLDLDFAFCHCYIRDVHCHVPDDSCVKMLGRIDAFMLRAFHSTIRASEVVCKKNMEQQHQTNNCTVLCLPSFPRNLW